MPDKAILQDRELSDLIEMDHALVKLARRVNILKTISWHPSLEERFLSGWKAGRVELPQPALARPDLHADIEAFGILMDKLDRGHPIGNWLHQTAWGYQTASRMLAAVGTPDFTHYSTALYGRPDTVHASQQASPADAARDVLAITDELIGRGRIPDVVANIPAEEFAVRLRERIGPFFDQDEVSVVLDPDLSAKAAAGSKRISLRSTALFSELDLEQLVQHEAFIHTATILSGRHQPYLKSLGLSSPRTTRAQEGLATFSEIITGSLDIKRLRRIALRVIMVSRALEGADFIEVFNGFLEAGQTPVESFRSAARIFRGGDVHGKTCFTKDGAYLHGLMIVYLFIRKTLQEGRPELLPLLFAGRMTTGDTLDLHPWFEKGLIVPATYVPPWAKDAGRVLSLMAFAAAANCFRLDTLSLDDFRGGGEVMIPVNSTPVD